MKAEIKAEIKVEIKVEIGDMFIVPVYRLWFRVTGKDSHMCYILWNDGSIGARAESELCNDNWYTKVGKMTDVEKLVWK